MSKFSTLIKASCLALCVGLPGLASAYDVWNKTNYNVEVFGFYDYHHMLAPGQDAPCNPSYIDCYGKLKLEADVEIGGKVMSVCKASFHIPKNEKGHFIVIKTADEFSNHQCYMQICRDGHGCTT
jgi:hypothetical protein